jgi:serine/threonine protein kinase
MFVLFFFFFFFLGIASIPAPAPLGAWESYFLCPDCSLPDFLSKSNAACLSSAVVYEIVEMSTALAHAVVRCRSNHRLSLNRVAPFLMLEHLSSQRLTEEQLKVRLMIHSRVGAGGFSHIYKGTLVDEASSSEQVSQTVAVKQYIQRKPIMFSFDSPEERAAKELEADQGALVVFRRLHHEVQMLAIKSFVTYEKNAEAEKDLERLLLLKMFSLKPPYVLTEYYEMGDVYRVLHNNYTFPQLEPGWLIGVAVDIARGMRFLHECVPQLIHRDLKTPNVYIKSLNPNDPLRAVVGDLGTLVPMFQAHRTDAAPVTNPIWMAPELILRKPYNGSVDVYSFGIIMWELATRQFPFTDMTAESLVDDKPLLRKAIGEGLRPPVPENCMFGPEYVVLMQKCWDQQPENRPSFGEVVLELITIKNKIAKNE